MDRRDFLKLASIAGLGVVSPSLYAEQAGLRGAIPRSYDPYRGKLFLMFNAGGGWDPTHLCDPKPKNSATDPDPMTNVLEVETSGKISYPAAFPLENYSPDGVMEAGVFIPEFFRQHYEHLLVINGIDMQTNGHDSGSRHTWSGRLSEGYPSLGAYMAASFDNTQPMAFLAFGGYEHTAGVVARTRAGSLDALAALAYPERVDPVDTESLMYHPPAVQEMIAKAQRDRDKALAANQGLPRIRQSINTLFAARAGSNELKLLQEYVPPLDGLSNLERQAAVAIAAYKAGICIAANLSIGGFDTHGNHDQSHVPQLEELLLGMDFAWREAERQGVLDQVVIGAGSDFGRTPGYNDGNGKDHWSITSMMFMGAGIPGNKVIGATDDGHRAFGIREDLSVDQAEGARRIEPKDIHYSLRRLAGVHENELAEAFPLDGPIDLFG